jgi:hypothetical protein
MARISPDFSRPLLHAFRCTKFEALSSGLIASMAFRAASISAAISIFSAPGADTRLRAGNVPGTRGPSDPHAAKARKLAKELSDAELEALEWIMKKRAKAA